MQSFGSSIAKINSAQECGLYEFLLYFAPIVLKLVSIVQMDPDSN